MIRHARPLLLLKPFSMENVFNILFLSYSFIGAQFFTYTIIEDDNLNSMIRHARPLLLLKPFSMENVFNILFLSYSFIGAQFFTYTIIEDDNLNKVRFLA